MNYLQEDFVFEDGKYIEVTPDKTKTVRFHSQVRAVVLNQEDSGDVIEALVTLIQESERLGFPITGYVFRTTSHGQSGFEEKPFSSNAMNQRIQTKLLKCGIFEGETVNGEIVTCCYAFFSLR